MKEDLQSSDLPEKNPEKNKTVKKGISRRGFLKGAGLTTAGTVVLQTGLFGKETSSNEEDRTIGPDGTSINLKVNGKVRKVFVEPRDTLAQTLREQLDLTGTKVGCDRGSCSACTVWLNKAPVNSCLTLTMDVGDREVTTIEGLAENGKFHPVQEAFIEHDATQCGFCTPGMIMTTAHLLENNPNPTLDEVKRSIRGNLCRCGTYPKVFNATLDAVKKM